MDKRERSPQRLSNESSNVEMMPGSLVRMPRHTSFRFCLDPSVEQERVLFRHVGAARFAFNQALRLHQEARAAAGRGVGGVRGGVRVPWSGFDLINAFNAWKAVVRLGRQHARTRNRRRHVLHQVPNQLVKTHALLVLEELNITGMTTNRRLSRAINDAAWGELARQIAYKQAWRGGRRVWGVVPPRSGTVKQPAP